MKLNFRKLGAAIMVTGPLFIQFAPNKAVWWVGFACLMVGPICLAIEPGKSKVNA